MLLKLKGHMECLLVIIYIGGAGKNIACGKIIQHFHLMFTDYSYAINYFMNQSWHTNLYYIIRYLYMVKLICIIYWLFY